jgi:hypothetical protein
VDGGLITFLGVPHAKLFIVEYQRYLEQAQGKNNAQMLFGVHNIPSDNQIRHPA